MIFNQNQLIKQASICGTTLFLILATSNSAIAQPFNCVNCDLKGIDLSSKQYLGAKRANSDLRGANLESANLSNNVFAGSDFRGANLRYTILTNTFFTMRANLEGADLRGARMNGTFFTNANLRNADLRGVQSINISLEGADLRGAKIDPNFFRNDTFLLNTILPDGRRVSGRLKPTPVRQMNYITSRCQLTSNQQSTFKLVFNDTFTTNSRVYRFYVGQYMDGAGVFCIANKDFSNASRLAISSIQGQFFSDIKRMNGKPVYKFNIRDGNGMNVPVTRYRLQLRNPRSPQIKAIDRWIDKIR